MTRHNASESWGTIYTFLGVKGQESIFFERMLGERRKAFYSSPVHYTDPSLDDAEPPIDRGLAPISTTPSFRHDFPFEKGSCSSPRIRDALPGRVLRGPTPGAGCDIRARRRWRLVV